MNRILNVVLIVLVTSLMGCRETREVPPLTREVEVYEPDYVNDDLVLAVEGGGSRAFILDKTGKKLHAWTFKDKLGNDLQLLPNGQVMGIFKHGKATITFAGGYGGYIRVINPNNAIAKEFEYVSNDFLSHHDMELLPNGNLLFLAWERIPADEAKKAGANVTYDIFPEKLVEIDTASGQIVWEWRSWDHIVQDLDPKQSNYGDIAQSPSRININYALQPNGDIMHANGLTFDEQRNIIFLTINHFDEVWVIDHSTTRAQAATSSGGNYNKGGDLLYRFGNPATYNNSQGRKLFDRVHYPNLIRRGLPGEGNMLLFNNGLKSKRSEVFEVDLPENFALTPGANNEPPVVWAFADSTLSYGRISGAARLSNGNTLICEGDYGFWEVTPERKVVWRYKDTATTWWRGYPFSRTDPAIEALGLGERK